MRKRSDVHLPWLLFLGLIWFMAHAAAQTSELYIETNDHSPLATVVRELADRHGLQITYEDPRWAHESDLVDNTDQFEGALERFKSGQGPRLLVPRKQKLELAYEVSELTGMPEDVTATHRKRYCKGAIAC